VSEQALMVKLAVALRALASSSEIRRGMRAAFIVSSFVPYSSQTDLVRHTLLSRAFVLRIG
jgi:hypothetical protein